MDRSKIKRIIYCSIWFLLLVPNAMSAPTKVVKTTKAEPKNSYSGILYGYIQDVRPDFSAITVKPIEKGEKRHRIYIDRSTAVFVDKKRKKQSSLYLGDKVAVRYFGQGMTIIADAIYVVFGEFVAKDYIEKKIFTVVKKDTAEKGKEGAHGAEGKKDAKPKSH
jgi:hypothetical protein